MYTRSNYYASAYYAAAYFGPAPAAAPLTARVRRRRRPGVAGRRR